MQRRTLYTSKLDGYKKDRLRTQFKGTKDLKASAMTEDKPGHIKNVSKKDLPAIHPLPSVKMEILVFSSKTEPK